MPQITRDSLWTLEEYARRRPAFRARVMEHKMHRKLHLGEHITLLFEDELTVRYQVQEMLRIERTFEEGGILDELSAYNPLIPDGSNLKATMMIEYPDPEERRHWLARLIGVEHRVWLRVGGEAPVFAIADEDMERDNGQKTSSVHFLRFEFTQAMRRLARNGAALSAGVDHPACRIEVTVAEPVRAALAEDFS